MFRMAWMQKRKGLVPKQLPGHTLKGRAVLPDAVFSIRQVLGCRFQGTIISVLLATIFLGGLSHVIAAPSGMKTLYGHVPEAVARLQPKGILPSTNRLHLAIGLPLRNTN